MNFSLPTKSCSKCNSKNSESFQQLTKRGIRCLSCGHEKLSIPNSQQAPDAHQYFNTNYDKNVF